MAHHRIIVHVRWNGVHPAPESLAKIIHAGMCACNPRALLDIPPTRPSYIKRPSLSRKYAPDPTPVETTCDTPREKGVPTPLGHVQHIFCDYIMWGSMQRCANSRYRATQPSTCVCVLEQLTDCTRTLRSINAVQVLALREYFI